VPDKKSAGVFLFVGIEALRAGTEAAGIFPDGESRPTKSKPRGSGRVARRKSATSWRPTSADRNWDLCGARLDLATFNRNPNQEVLRVTWNNQASNCKPVFKSSDRLLMSPQMNHYRMRDSSIQNVDNGRLFSRDADASPRDPVYPSGAVNDSSKRDFSVRAPRHKERGKQRKERQRRVSRCTR